VLSDLLLVERRDHVATLTLNRPEQMNAMTPDMMEDLHATLDALEAEWPEIRVIVLTATGRGFCAGTDMRTLARTTGNPPAEERDRSARSIVDFPPRLRRLPQPVIAAVNGVAVGPGFAIVLGCDLCIASEHARFSTMFVNRSLPPDGGMSSTLPDAIGPTAAAEMMLTGRTYDAAWAERSGLVNVVVPHEQLLSEAVSLAAEIAAKPPLAVRQTKELMHRNARPLDEIVVWELDGVREVQGTEDFREAIASFVEHRTGTFHGR
jgi:enoyl-CoA hydratase/carnithine racemase